MSDSTKWYNTAVGGAAAGGLMDGIGSLFTIGAQKRAATTAYKRQKEFWNMQNAYNTPKAQMERLKAAGLNPALMYGQGNTGNAQGLSSVSKADVQGPKLAQSAAAGAQMSLVNQQRQLMKEQALAAKINASATFMNAMTNKGKLKLENKIAIPTIQNLMKDLEVKNQNIAESESVVGLNEVRSRLAEEQISLTSAQEMVAVNTVNKLKSDVSLQDEIIKEYNRGISRNSVATIANLLSIDNMDSFEARAKVVTAVVAATPVGRLTGLFGKIVKKIKDIIPKL